MHTLSIFPALLDFVQLGPFFIRIMLAITLAMLAERAIRMSPSGGRKVGALFSKAAFQNGNVLHVLELAAGILIFIGLFTQVAALAAIILLVIRYVREKRVGPTNIERTLFLKALVVMALSLMFTGPGFLAFDLPL